MMRLPFNKKIGFQQPINKFVAKTSLIGLLLLSPSWAAQSSSQNASLKNTEALPLLLELSNENGISPDEVKKYPLTASACCEFLKILSYYQKNRAFFETYADLQNFITVSLDENSLPYYQPLPGKEGSLLLKRD